MSFRSWREADEVLAAATGSVTPKQQELANFVDRPIPPHTPSLVAAATLRLALAQELALPANRPVSDRYREWLQILRRPSDPAISPQTEEEADAWVTYLRLVRRRESLSKLKLNEGDIVETNAGEVVEVSSIGQDGRVFFKGGRGFGAWPDLVSVVAPRDEYSDSATEARRLAENAAARRAAALTWSMARSHDLAEFAAENVLTENDIAELEAVITSAEDERPIQTFFSAQSTCLTLSSAMPTRSASGGFSSS